jgi:iron transport multicopper oxidase
MIMASTGETASVNGEVESLLLRRATINGVSYVGQKVPTLFTAMSAPKNVVMNPLIYGANSNSFVFKLNQTVEIVLINEDSGGHPWHLHGHNFQLIARSPPNTPYKASAIHPPHTPMRRDVVQVNTGGYIVLRFTVDHPDMSRIQPLILKANILSTHPIVPLPYRMAR